MPSLHDEDAEVRAAALLTLRYLKPDQLERWAEQAGQECPFPNPNPDDLSCQVLRCKLDPSVEAGQGKGGGLSSPIFQRLSAFVPPSGTQVREAAQRAVERRSNRKCCLHSTVSSLGQALAKHHGRFGLCRPAEGRHLQVLSRLKAT